MADFVFLVVTLVSFAGLALMVGALDRADQRTDASARPSQQPRR